MKCFILFTVVSLISTAASDDVKAPNIVFVIADDLGWNDVSYHGSDLNSPVSRGVQSADTMKQEYNYNKYKARNAVFDSD